MKFFVVLFAFIAAASAGFITPYAWDAPVLSVHESHAPLVTTLHHTGAVVAPAFGYHAPLAYHAPAIAYHAPAYGFGLAGWRKKRSN